MKRKTAGPTYEDRGGRPRTFHKDRSVEKNGQRESLRDNGQRQHKPQGQEQVGFNRNSNGHQTLDLVGPAPGYVRCIRKRYRLLQRLVIAAVFGAGGCDPGGKMVASMRTSQGSRPLWRSESLPRIVSTSIQTAAMRRSMSGAISHTS